MTITQAELHEMLAYDAETGVFAWREPGRGRKGEAGSIAPNGYRQIGIHGRRYQAHRLAYLYVHGVWPCGDVDHINGARADNRICNLRDVTRSENMQNQHVLQRRNVSGCQGVRWNEKTNRWLVRIGLNGVGRHIGSFTSVDAAIAARLRAERALHPARVAREFA